KNRELLEGNLELLARGQIEEVVTVFERHDPAVEQLLRAAQLPAEVVDQEDAAVGLDVQRSLVKVRLGVEFQVEHGQVQFTARNDNRPADAYPARIDRSGIEQAPDGRFLVFQPVVGGLVGKLMYRLVVDGDDAVLCEEGVGDVDVAAAGVHEVADAAGHCRLAVAGRPEDEDRLAADDGRADGVEQFFLDHQVRKRRAESVDVDRDARDGLAVNLLDVIFERHRRRANVRAQLHRVLRSASAEFGEREAVTNPADEVAARHLEAFLVLEELQRLLDYLEGQTREPGQFQAEQGAANVERAQNQVVEEAERQPGLRQRFRRTRCFGQPGAFPFESGWLGGLEHGVESFRSTQRKQGHLLALRARESAASA